MLDFLAGGLEMGGAWVVGNKRRWGFLLLALCDVLWIVFVLSQQVVYGLLLVVVPMLGVNLRNFIKWGKIMITKLNDYEESRLDNALETLRVLYLQTLNGEGNGKEIYVSIVVNMDRGKCSAYERRTKNAQE